MRKYFTADDPIVPTHHPRALVETALAQGADRTALLSGTGLTYEALGLPETRLSYVQYRRLCVTALRLTGNPALGLDTGLATQLPQLGILGLALQSSATIAMALDLAIRYFSGVAPVWELSLARRDPLAHLTLDAVLPLGRLQAFATEVVLAALDAQGRALLGYPLPVRAVHLAYPQPPYHARYGELYDVDFEFDAGSTCIDFDASLLDAPIPHADPATFALAERYVAEQAAPAHASRGLVPQVRELLGSMRPPAGLEAMARKLQTSERSLRRELAQQGTSYSELLEEHRRSRAHKLVCATNLPLEEVAAQLGFADVRSFRRAFKRWTGHTPAELRGAERS